MLYTLLGRVYETVSSTRNYCFPLVHFSEYGQGAHDPNAFLEVAGSQEC